MLNIPPVRPPPAGPTVNPDDRPLQRNAPGQYNLNFVDYDNEYETHPEEQRQRRHAEFQTMWSRFLYFSASDTNGGAAAGHGGGDGMTDAQFEAEFPYERLLELDAHLERRGGLTATQMRELLPPKRGLVVDCSICLEKTKRTEKVVSIGGCAHSFHSHCLQGWFAENTTCPNCRYDLMGGARANEEQKGAQQEEDEEEEDDEEDTPSRGDDNTGDW